MLKCTWEDSDPDKLVLEMSLLTDKSVQYGDIKEEYLISIWSKCIDIA
jgi:hypothetical protein